MPSPNRSDATMLLSFFSEFRKDMERLYLDSQMTIKRQFTKKGLALLRENWWCYDSLQNNQLILQYHCNVSKVVYGISFVYAVDHTWIQTGSLYSNVIDSLGIDGEYPLVCLYGIYDPLDQENYSAKEWVILILGINNWCDECKLPLPYNYNQDIAIKTGIPKESNSWFGRCKVRIQHTLEIADQDGLKTLVGDLVAMRF